MIFSTIPVRSPRAAPVASTAAAGASRAGGRLRSRRAGRWPVVGVALLLLAGCQEVEEIRSRFRAATPRERYAESLRLAGLAQTALARDWTAAARRALAEPHQIAAPFRETGYLPPERATAVGYEMYVPRGRRLTFEIELIGNQSALLFLDLFRMPEDSTGAPRRVASADSGMHRLEYEPEDDAEYVLRLQPELLRGGRYTLSVLSDPSLAFPVDGADESDIQSVFGDPRDGGARDHHGVDIFSDRGTPVIAAAAGVVRRVRTTNLGGKVVWIRDSAHGQSLYYAHLDSQLVANGDRVEPGDTVGLIGNTGNARTTPPHLHFGIYRRHHGPVDPYPYVYENDALPEPLDFDVAVLGEWIRTTHDSVLLRSGPSLDAPAATELPLHTAMRVAAASGPWYRVDMPDGASGFLAARLTETIGPSVRNARLAGARGLYAQPEQGAVLVDSIGAQLEIPVLGRFGTFLYVEAPSGQTGWVPVGSS